MTRLALILPALLAVGCAQPTEPTSPDHFDAPDAIDEVGAPGDAPKRACAEPMWREGAAGLQVASKAFLQDGALVVGVLSIEDSRCPDGVQCVWEGEATATLGIQTDGDVVFREVRERESTRFDGYEISVMDISRAEAAQVILGIFELEAVACPVTV